MIETLSIKDQSKDLEKLAEQSTAAADAAPVASSTLTIDQMFRELESAWQEVKRVIQGRAEGTGVRPYLMGTKGVTSTVDEMVTKGVITKRAADLAKAVSAQYQWFYRTTSPKEEWLSEQVHSTFVAAASEAMRALQRRPV